MEIYDPAKDQWELGVPMTSGRSGHASAVSYQQCLKKREQVVDKEVQEKEVQGKAPSWH